MRRTTYRDPEGRRFEVYIPDGAPDAEAYRGAIIGPPPLDALGLPPAVEIRLNQELHARGLITARDIRRRRGDLGNALKAALRLDVETLQAAYALTGDASPP